MKILKRVMLFLLALVLILFMVGYLFFKFAPQIGGEAEGVRLIRMEQAQNFKDGLFENTLETNMAMTMDNVGKTLNHYLFADKSKKNPNARIETIPFQPSHYLQPNDSAIKITWFGHSSVLVQLDGLTILADPILEGTRASMFSFMGPERFDYTEHVSVSQLPKIDAVIISHDHYDHLDYPTILALKDQDIDFFMPLGVGAHLEAWGVSPDRIKELEWWDEIEFGELKLALTPMRHFSGRSLTDRFKTLWGSWVVMGKQQRLFFSGDGGYFPGFKEIGDKYGPFDITFMECGAYNEGWSEIHMFPEQTAQAHLDVKGELLMPIHWGKFDLALHPWKESVNRLSKKAEEENIHLFTPVPGQTTSVPLDQELNNWWTEK